MTVTGSQLYVGESANTASGAVIEDADGKDVTENYDISYIAGTLTVTKASIEVTARNDIKVYDGIELTNSDWEHTSGTLAAGDELEVTVEGSITNVGEAENKITAVKVMHDGTDVTANYIITPVNGKLTVTKRPLEITAGSATKTYDGTPLTNEDYSITSGSLVAGHAVASVTLTGSQTEVGSSANVASAAVIMDGDVDVTGNYDITYVDGTLVVNRKSSSQVVVVVNGQGHEAGKEMHIFEDGKSTVIVEVNKQVIENKINEAITNNPSGTGNTIEIPVADPMSKVAKVGLTGDMVKKLEENAFAVFVKQDKVEYIIPAEEFTISQVAENLGVAQTNLQEIKVEVKISKTDGPAAVQYDEMVKANGAELLFPPVEFAIAAKTKRADGTTGVIEISTFNNFVERVMELPAGTDPNKITTGVVFNTDGTYYHVPTEVFQKDGRWYAKINSLTNSAYSLIWNSVTVQSVENHWAKETVNDLASRLVIFNPETFEPDQAITRADFAEYIVRALGLYREGAGDENWFTDVQNTDPRAQAIAIAAQYRIVSGYPDGTFRPEQHITREEAMAMYQRAMALTKLTGSDKDRYQNYTDFAEVSSWAAESVKAVQAADVINGTSAVTISPKVKLTYAESAQAVKNLLVESELINK